MKKQILISIILGIILILAFLSTKPFLIEANQEIKLGYCPTMQGDAITLSEKENYELIRFGSASEVLSALNDNLIDKALIGRKAESNEISNDVKEKILESGYTFVSNNKRFIDYFQLSSLEIYTYLNPEKIEKLIPEDENINYIESKKEAIKKINEGKIVLISWEDWQDDFELIVVMKGNDKVKDFRGVFLYEN